MDTPTEPLTSTGKTRPGYDPLYRQVKRQLIERIAANEWPPGGVLPSETHLAVELGVSQGTVRKALDELASENLVVRRQGRGTFVSEHDQQRTLFQFFKITADSGKRQFPETTFSRRMIRKADRREREQLGLDEGASVWRVLRHRSLEGHVLVVERIALSAGMFPDFDRHEPLPNNVYRLYEQHYGLTVTRAVEKLKAVPCGSDDAEALGCSEGDPVLRIDRIGYGITGRTIELRESICLTEGIHYLSDLH